VEEDETADGHENKAVQSPQGPARDSRQMVDHRTDGQGDQTEYQREIGHPVHALRILLTGALEIDWRKTRCDGCGIFAIARPVAAGSGSRR
jgi:hypothetical protein